MKNRNFVMQAAVASALLVSASTYATAVPVIIGTSSTAALFAKEIIATASAPVSLTNSGNILDLKAVTGYAMSTGEVRYVRMTLDNSVVFPAIASVSTTTSCSAGAINGLGTNTITFSLTAASASCNASSSLTVTASSMSIVNTNTVTATYSLYDQPSQAIAGGTGGQIGSAQTGSYITFASSFVATGNAGTKAVADVSANGTPFSKFLVNALTTTTVAGLGTLTYALAATVPNKIEGTPIGLSDLMATGSAGTTLVVTGDFSAAPTRSATAFNASSVFMASNASCATGGSIVYSSTLTATTATFNVGTTATTGVTQLCYTVTGSIAVPAKVYSASLNPVSVAPAVYAVSSIGSLPAGEITRNGSQVDVRNYIPLAVTGYSQTIRVYNGGALATDVSVSLINEATGAVSLPVVVASAIPANGSVRLSQVAIEAAVGVQAVGNRPRLRFTAPSTLLEIQSLFNNANGAYTNLSGIEATSVSNNITQ